MKMHKLALSALAAAALVGCSSTKLDEPAPVENRPVAPAPAPAQTGGAPVAESKVQTVDLAAEAARAVSDKRIVFFDFDSYVVKSDFQNVIDAHAKRMSVDTKVALRLEGHTDERGGSEYNLALGQKRSEAVAKSLSLLGVPAARVEPVSFGKERPAVQGSDEAAWAKNRRVELKDK
ncbi:peptidoglycan-associated lipoprotein Pal [Roseateles sp. DAIF2]|uniref:peptidoglycan-associated lipoprotein Pal n=1 Tax=Roseateles sp. DAIF2 TaxID=2714952 RepID=UPI0018A2E6BC|nr:peptidoglycan-associated lipoprotein Pal [Roseateles sp. DAIF2]QPF74805.1 peptidoglycan-associated lipoprotein Pal [Roseateles sp. DAIF2]